MTATAINRRTLLQLGAGALGAAALSGCASGPTPTIDSIVAGYTPGAPPNMATVSGGGSSKVQIVDTGHGTNATFLRALADNGVKTIFRYYAQGNNLPGKNITARERDMIFDHGLSIAIVYQWEAYRPGRFNPAAGREDARFCMERAAEIGQPHGSAIFFAVDNDSHSREDVVAYLEAVKRTLDGRFQIGCYGSGYQCAGVIDAGCATMAWIAEAPAWRGSREFINSRRWHIFQNKTQIESNRYMSAGGIPIDTDILNSRYDSIGAFDRHGSVVRYDSATVRQIYDRRMFVTATQLNIRERPHGRVTSHVCVARTVHVLSIENGWARLDLDEDGRADGYCSAEFLVPLHQMPAYVRGCTPERL